MRICSKEYLDYSDVLIKPKKSFVSSRKDVCLMSSKVDAVPVMITNMDSTGTFEAAKVAQEYDMMTVLHKFYEVREIVEFFEKQDINHFGLTWISIGMSEADLVKLYHIERQLTSSWMPPILVDIANGHLKDFSNFIRKMRNQLPKHKHTIFAGNVCTKEGVRELAKAGVDGVRIGIGPGGQCLTRTTAGVGMPQLSAAIECSKEAKKHGILSIADGGIIDLADFAKALAAGADIVCAGSIFAGHDESGGDLVYDKDDKPFKEVYGMSSESAMRKNYGKKDAYRTSEGRTSLIPYRGPLKNTIEDVLGALRSTCTYTNTSKIEDLCKNTTFIKVKNRVNFAYDKYTTGK
ncbi:GMP reductase [Caulobacter phage Cr30]|uniref:dehydrogenase n=1 Tax=Caulobacter phage Cr30 TaxID=1357714 RepID=UPI0004A9B6AA|nr:dehydrogenase [Caulobacter phage Cr30]AGS80910.1 GMP reductase [Caulobacter phage Cr30]